MKNQLSELSDKAFDLFLQLEKIDVLTNDIYCDYFGKFENATPEEELMIKYYFRQNRVKSIIIRNLMPHILRLASELSKEIEKRGNSL